MKPQPRQLPRAACMGGWCNTRGGCDRYKQAERVIVVERLCPKDPPKPVAREVEGA